MRKILLLSRNSNKIEWRSGTRVQIDKNNVEVMELEKKTSSENDDIILD